MDTYYCNFPSVQRSVEALISRNKHSEKSPTLLLSATLKEKQSFEGRLSSLFSNHSCIGPLSSLVAKNMSSNREKEQNIFFVRTMHETTTSLSFFDELVWHETF